MGPPETAGRYPVAGPLMVLAVPAEAAAQFPAAGLVVVTVAPAEAAVRLPAALVAVPLPKMVEESGNREPGAGKGRAVPRPPVVAVPVVVVEVPDLTVGCLAFP